MCVSLQPSKMSDTILYGAQVSVGGQVRHVLGYQNKAENLSSLPNAMILPFPAKEPMTSHNALCLSENKKLLTELAHPIQLRELVRTRHLKGLIMTNSRGFEVFEHGMYTVVLAEDAGHVPEALQFVPEKKRPELNPAIFRAYSKWYPGWPIAVCCFAGKVEPDPLMWWYVPKSEESIFLPALDAHDGGVPRLQSRHGVAVDHVIVIGTSLRGAYEFKLSEPVSNELKPYLPKLVSGRVIKAHLPNGDFYVPIEEARGSTRPCPERHLPPGS